MVGIPLFESKHAPVLWLTVLVGVAPRVAQPGDIKGWGVAARTEAQWCHPFETSELPGIVHASNSQEYHASPLGRTGTSFDSYLVGLNESRRSGSEYEAGNEVVKE
jgi:hypothetical protein